MQCRGQVMVMVVGLKAWSVVRFLGDGTMHQQTRTNGQQAALGGLHDDSLHGRVSMNGRTLPHASSGKGFP